MKSSFIIVTLLIGCLCSSVLSDASCSIENNCQLETSTSIPFPFVQHDVKNKRICEVYQLGHYDKKIVWFTKTVVAIGIYRCKFDEKFIDRHIKKHKKYKKQPEHDNLDLMILLKPFMSSIPNGLYKSYLNSDIETRGNELGLKKKYIEMLKESIRDSINRNLVYGDTITLQMSPGKQNQLSVKHDGHEYYGNPFSTSYVKDNFPRHIFYKLYKILRKEYENGITYTNSKIKINV